MWKMFNSSYFHLILKREFFPLSNFLVFCFFPSLPIYLLVQVLRKAC